MRRLGWLGFGAMVGVLGARTLSRKPRRHPEDRIAALLDDPAGRRAR